MTCFSGLRITQSIASDSSSNHPVPARISHLSELRKLFSNQAFCALKNLRPLRGVSVSLQFVPLPPFVDRLSKLHERRRVLCLEAIKSLQFRSTSSEPAFPTSTRFARASLKYGTVATRSSKEDG